MIIADVLARGLVAQDQRIGAAAVQQAQGDAGIPRMNQAPLPFHEDDVGVLRRLEHQPFRRPGDEVGHHGVHGDPPAFDEDPGLPGGDEAGAMPPLDQRVPQLDLGGHLADVAVGPYREHHQRADFRGATVGDRQVGGRFAGIQDADVLAAGQRPQLRVIRDEGVQAAPDLQPALDGAAQPAAPFGRQATAHRRDADEHGGRAQPETLLEVPHDRERAAEPQHVLDGFARLRAVEHPDDPLGHVADAAIGGLRRHRLELPVGDDEELVSVLRRHQTGSFSLGARNSAVVRSTAGS